MSIDKKILEEIRRYKNINKYILEQETPPGEELPPPPGGEVAPPPPTEPTPQPVDIKNDPDVEEVGNETEELDITDLIDTQKTFADKQEEYFNNLFSQLSNLESKLSEMDSIMSRLNSIESKIEKYRTKTPEERLELRSYDSYPFNQKLSDFFEDKEKEMELTGKKEYILTPDEVTDVNASEIKGTFQPTKTDDNRNYGSR